MGEHPGAGIEKAATNEREAYSVSPQISVQQEMLYASRSSVFSTLWFLPWGIWRAKILPPRQAGKLLTIVSKPISIPTIAVSILELPLHDVV